jgi:hypothetical protein
MLRIRIVINPWSCKRTKAHLKKAFICESHFFCSCFILYLMVIEFIRDSSKNILDNIYYVTAYQHFRKFFCIYIEDQFTWVLKLNTIKMKCYQKWAIDSTLLLKVFFFFYTCSFINTTSKVTKKHRFKHI